MSAFAGLPLFADAVIRRTVCYSFKLMPFTERPLFT